ncbi:homoserine kinase [Sediminibacillus halophilus]|uniref:Homoserine kinase n=1 Tax=Sediminibacillus halophilus TaxID=482461 RepID=A0A1G9QRV9_9BACI|nr:homoserine kinase [Sediminibacillus halophilus]SDM13736.1 homoserine kinase [Sediminibacillus halophilus]
MNFAVKIPCSTSNLGAGFDSIGLALNLYLEMEAKKSDVWEFISITETLQGLPSGKDNFIYQIAEKVAKKYGIGQIPPCQVKVKSGIPLARGLGSSATATLAGIELANQLLDLQLGIEDKLAIATTIEGHPDNVAPSLLGGCVIGHYQQEVNYVQLPFENVSLIAIIPEYELKTKAAREVLPQELSFQTSVHASSIANVSVAAICQQNWSLLGNLMKKDLFHQPYRKKLVPHFEQLQTFLEEKVYGLFISGAGPTVIALAEKNCPESKIAEWQNNFPTCQWIKLQVDTNGMEVRKAKTP